MSDHPRCAFVKVCDPVVDVYCAKWWDDGLVTIHEFGESSDRSDISCIKFWDQENSKELVPGCTNHTALNFGTSGLEDNSVGEHVPAELTDHRPDPSAMQPAVGTTGMTTILLVITGVEYAVQAWVK